MNKQTEALKLAEEFLVNHFTAYSADKVKILAAIREALAEPVNEHKCGGCAKTAADGWALYCVECWEKAEPVKQEPKCNPHPDAPHGFDRNASHSADRYVCECEGWEPPKQEPVAVVDEIGKRLDGTDIFNAMGKVEVGQLLYAAPVDAKAIRAEALEEAAKVAAGYDAAAWKHCQTSAHAADMVSASIAAAIRGLK